MSHTVVSDLNLSTIIAQWHTIPGEARRAGRGANIHPDPTGSL